MSRKIIGREKRYVEVDVRFEPDGHLRPLAIRFGPEHVYVIDKIKDVSRRAAEVGGVGDRYVCVIHGQGDQPLDGKRPLVCGGKTGGGCVTICAAVIKSKCRGCGELFSASRRFASMLWRKALFVVRVRAGHLPWHGLKRWERCRYSGAVLFMSNRI